MHEDANKTLAQLIDQKSREAPPRDREYGRATFWSETGGYGFIRPDADGRDLFMHCSELRGGSIRIGDRVSYEIGEDKKGRPCAKAVHVNGGE